MKNKFLITIMTCALMTPVAMMARAYDDHHDDHDKGFYDKKHKDYHHFDEHEDRAYRIYLQQHHRKYVEYNALNARDQANYWDWRHSHSDSLLKIEIH